MITIRKATFNDVNEIAKIHLQTFNNFFLSSLAYNFLKLYYKSCLQSEKCVALCAFENDKMLGFAFGSILAKGFHKDIFLNNFLSFFKKGIIIFFSKPKDIIRIIKNFNKNKNKIDDGNYAELLSIGVIPESKGKGVGKQLLNFFEKIIKNYNCNKITLTTDFFKNDIAISFYNSCGYEEFYTFTTYPDRKMFKLIKNI